MKYSSAADAANSFHTFLSLLLSSTQGIEPGVIAIECAESIQSVLSLTSKRLRDVSKASEADALDQVLDKVTQAPSFGGLGLSSDMVPSSSQFEEVTFLCEAWLESVRSKGRSINFLNVNTTRTQGVKPMTLAQKIFTQHALGSKEAEHGLVGGDVVRVGIDWVIASELSWSGMARIYEEMGSPGIWRNDRFWIAGDHVVHPTITDNPRSKHISKRPRKRRRIFA